MKTRFITFLKENKKKMAAFLVAALAATLGVSLNPEALNAAADVLAGFVQ